MFSYTFVKAYVVVEYVDKDIFALVFNILYVLFCYIGMDRFNMDVQFMVGRDIPAVIRISMAFLAPLAVLVRKRHLPEFLPLLFNVFSF